MKAFGIPRKNSLLRIVNNPSWLYLSNTKSYFQAVEIQNCDLDTIKSPPPLFPDTRTLIVTNCSNEFINSFVKEYCFPMLTDIYLDSPIQTKLRYSTELIYPNKPVVHKDPRYAYNPDDVVFNKDALDKLLQSYGFETILKN